MASTTFRIDSLTVTVIDPKTLSWQEIEQIFPGTLGQPNLSKMRSAIAVFNAITQTQSLAWIQVCDDMTAHTIYLPRRIDAVYETNPETFSGTTTVVHGQNADAFWAATYGFHWLSGSFSTGSNMYNMQIEIYMRMQIRVRPGGG